VLEEAELASGAGRVRRTPSQLVPRLGEVGPFRAEQLGAGGPCLERALNLLGAH
jgi:hypothetical protein